MRWIGQITYDEVAYFREDVIIEAGNKLGIGTTSPGEILHLESTAPKIKLSNSQAPTGYFTTLEQNYSYAGPSFAINSVSGATTRILLGRYANNVSILPTGTGNVGIGTSSPGYKLDVNGEILADGLRLNLSDTVQRAITSTGTESIQIGDAGVNDIRFKNASGSVARMLANGNVGIGTTSPTRPLHVVNTSSQTVAIFDGGNNGAGEIAFTGAGTSGGTYVTVGAVGDNMSLSAGAVERMRITSSGNVGIGITAPTQALHLPDSKQIALGTGADLKIQHNGTNSEIGNSTGQLNIYNHADNSDINFMADNNSGGLLTYFFLDGSEKTLEYRVPLNIGVDDTGHDVKFFGATSGKYMLWDESDDRLWLTDNTHLELGTGGDLQMLHNGSASFIQNYGGDLKIINNANDKDIIFQSDDGSGGVETYFYLDGSANVDGNPRTKFPDGSRLILGDGDDLEIYHNSVDSWLRNNTGDFKIVNYADDKDIILYCDDGSGGATPYLTLDGTAGHTVANKEIHFLDNVLARFGSTNDFAITHNGTNTTFENGTGNLVLSNYADDADIIFQSDDGGGGVSTYFYLDGSLTETNFQVRTRHVDNAQAWFGNSGDLQIYHDGTYNVIKAMSGHMLIKQDSDDQDIIFQCDNGSGGTTAYLTLDGSEGRTVVAKAMRFNDSTSLQLGSDADIQMHHDGSNGFFNNITGDLYFRQTADDKDIVFQGDNGSGGLATYFTLDGSLANGTATYTRWADNDVITLGDSQDCYFYHNATNTYLYNNTGDLIITNVADDKDIILKSDDGSGGTTAYLTLDGGLGRTTVQKNMQFADNAELWLGDGPDFKMLHDGSNTHLQQFGTGNLYIQQTTDDKDIIFQCDNGSGGTATYLQIDGGSTRTRAFKDINFDDNIKATYGAGSDLQIYHNGSHSYILNTTGDLVFNQSTDDGNILFYCDNGSGGVETYLTLDGGLGHTTIDKRLRANDNVDFTVGTGNDLRLIHDGAHSYITNYTGDFYIANHADDKDIIFQSDNGSGGLTEYLRIDGGSEEVIFSKPIVTAETQIKVLPHQFMSNEDGGANKSVQFRDDTIIGVRTTADDAELYAFVEIPYGKTATNVTVYGNDTSLVVNVYESDINAGALTDKTPGAGCRVGGACDIDDVEYSATNYLVIKVTTVSYTNDIVYGAVVTIT